MEPVHSWCSWRTCCYYYNQVRKDKWYLGRTVWGGQQADSELAVSTVSLNQMELLSQILWGVEEYYWGRREIGPSCMLTLRYLRDKWPMRMTCPNWMKNQAVHHSLHFCAGELSQVQYMHRSLKPSSSNYDHIVISLALRFLTSYGFHLWRLVETQ